jgi:urease accessory protein
MIEACPACSRDRIGNPEPVRPFSGRPKGTSDRDLQRASGLGHLTLGSFEGKTRINNLFQKSPIRIMFPRSTSGALEEAVLINTAGGIAGGDRLEYKVALADASIAVTSQAAEKIYRSLDEPSTITTKLRAFGATRLAWLPQETIIFNRARINRLTEIEVSSQAQLIALEWFVLGRAARGEAVTDGCIIDSWRVKKEGQLVWADTFQANTKTVAHLSRRALLFDCNAIGTLIYFGPDVEAWINMLRENASQQSCQCVVTVVAGLIIARFAAKVSLDLRLAVGGMLEQFGRRFAGAPFGIPKMWSC